MWWTNSLCTLANEDLWHLCRVWPSHKKTDKRQYSGGLADSSRCAELDEISGEERQENLIFAWFWKGLHMSIAIRRKSDVWAHCRVNRQSELDMGPWNLVGEAPMTDECVVLTENGVQKAKSLHRVTPKEKFLITELEKAREFPWNDVAENLKSATETHLDQGPGSWWGLEQHLDAVPDRDFTRKHVGCDREEHWLTRKKAGMRHRSEQELDRLQKWQWSSNSQQRWCSRNHHHHHLLVLPRRCKNRHKTFRASRRIHRWKWEHRTAESKGKRDWMRGYHVKCARDRWWRQNQYIHQRSRQWWRSLGLIVLLDPAPFSKYETTIGSVHTIDGIDVVAALVPEEDVWQFEVMKTYAKEIQFQDGEQESVAIVDYEDPILQKPSTSAKQGRVRSSTQKKCGQEKPKRCKSLMSSNSKWKLSSRRFEWHQERRCGQNGWKHGRIHTSLGTSFRVSAIERAVLNWNQGPSVPRDVDGRVIILNLIRVKVSCSVFFWQMQVSRIWRLVKTEIPFRFTWYHPRTSAGNVRFGACSRIAAVFVTRVTCLQRMLRKVSTNTVFRKTHWCPGGTGKTSFWAFQVSE